MGPNNDDQDPTSNGHGTVRGAALVKSLNFEFLRAQVPLLSDLGGFAEKYAHGDPPSAAVKLRNFAEELVEQLYQRHRLPRPYNAQLIDLLEDRTFTAATPNVIQLRLHALRKTGNKGAHGNSVTSETIVARLDDALNVARWFYLTVLGGTRDQTPEALKEPPPESTKSLSKVLQQELDKQRQLDAQREDEMVALQAALKAECEKAANAEAAKQEVERALVKTEEELATIRQQGEQVATNILHLNEEETRRRFIDEALVDVGWDVGSHGKSTEEVGQEVVIKGLPTGYATGK